MCTLCETTAMRFKGVVLVLGHIGMLQATQMTQEVTIRDLESEKSRLKEKLSQLEEERNLLQSKTQSLDERQRQQILALEKVKQLTDFS